MYSECKKLFMDMFPLLQGPKSVIKSELLTFDCCNPNPKLKNKNGLKMPKSVHGHVSTSAKTPYL